MSEQAEADSPDGAGALNANGADPHADPRIDWRVVADMAIAQRDNYAKAVADLSRTVNDLQINLAMRDARIATIEARLAELESAAATSLAVIQDPESDRVPEAPQPDEADGNASIRRVPRH